MAKLTRPVTRTLEHIIIRGRFLVARMQHDGMLYKLKGERWTSGYLVPWEVGYMKGAALTAAIKLAEKPRRSRLVKRGILSLGL